MSERQHCHLGELLSLPRQLLVPLPHSLRPVSTGAVTSLAPLPCAAPGPQLYSSPQALAQSHFSLPWEPTPQPPRFLLSFTLWFYLRFSLLAQTGERKDGPEVRVIAWAEESRIQFSATDFSSHHGHAISPLSAYHCLLQSTAQRYLLKAGNTLNVMLATSHFRKSCPLQLDGCP